MISANCRSLSLVACVVLVAAGCGLSSSTSSSMKGRSWSSGGTEPKPGITVGEVNVITLSQNGAPQTAVFWADATDCLSGMKSSSGTSGGMFQMTVTAADGMSDIAVDLDAQGLASVAIGDQQYSLAAGNVFLLKTSGDALEIRQLQIDADWMGLEDYQPLAEDSDDIQTFFLGAVMDADSNQDGDAGDAGDAGGAGGESQNGESPAETPESPSASASGSN